jgi:hypothetical protein
MQETTNVEIWKCITNYTNYQVSNLGRVKNFKGMVLKPCENKYGYLYVNLYMKGVRKLQKLHRLVALEFIQNPSNKYSVDHIDGVKTNNKLINLRWATSQEQRMNTTKQAANTSSQYKGVSWSKRMNKWEAYINIENKQVILGYFTNEEEAGLAYNLKAAEHFGEFGKLNMLECFKY